MILSFVLFLLASFICFTIPGIYILGKTKYTFSSLEKIVLGTIVGFVTFTLLSYLLLIFKISFFILPAVSLINILYLKSIFHVKINLNLGPKRHLAILSVVFILGMIGQLAIIAPSGLEVNSDLVFFSANGHDGTWHMALMEEIKKGYPLQNPIFAGERLVNYHFFSDVAPSLFSQYFKFSNLDLYFRFFPFLHSLMLGSIAFLLGRKLSNSFIGGVWSAFFVYFAGSFGYILTWIKDKNIGGESIFWATQIQSSIGNPPQIISNILVLSIIYLLIILIAKRNFWLFVICTLLLGSLIEFKVYASIVVLISLGALGLLEFIKEKKFYLLSLFGLSSLVSAALYLPNSVSSSSFLIFEPWWFIRTMIVVDSRLNMLDMELRRQTYLAEGNLKRVIQLELTGFLIFFFGNLGMRFLGLIYVFKTIKKVFINYILFLLLLISLVSLIMPLLFLQKGVASNTIQFLQYFLLIFGLFASLTVTDLQKRIRNSTLKTFFIFAVIIFSIPTQIGLLYDFYHKPPIAKITSLEIDALNFLKNNTSNNSIVLVPPFDKNLNLKISTPPIWAWFDTSYVSAFSSKKIFVSDTEQIDIMGYDFKNRLNIAKFIFESEKKDSVLKLLRNIQIDYVYFPKLLKPKIDISSVFSKVFDNGQTEIWKIN